MQGERVKPNSFILGLLAAFLALRCFSLLTAPESIVDPEELYRGTIAYEILRGPAAPILDYQADPYDGGSTAVGLLAVPFFKLLGPSLFALKLVPILFAGGTLALLTLFLMKFFGRATALTGAALYILAPPNFVRLTSAAIGSHSESVLFTIALFYLAGSWHRESRKIAYFYGFAFAAGLGFWFTSMTAMTTVTCLIFLFFSAEHRSKMLQKALIAAIFFLLGAAPWIYFNATHQLAGAHFFVEVFAPAVKILQPEYFAAVVKKVLRLLFIEMPRQSFLEPFGPVSGKMLSLAYFICSLTAIGCCYAILFRKNAIARLLGIYLFVYIVTFGLSRYDIFYYVTFIDSRYSVPLQFTGLLLTAIGLRAMPPLFSRTFFGFLIILGLIGQRSMLLQAPFGQALTYKGYSYDLINSEVLFRIIPLHSPVEKIEATLSRFEAQDRPVVYQIYTYDLFTRPETSVTELEAQFSARILPHREAAHFENLGIGYSGHVDHLSNLPAAAAGLPRLQREAFERGFAFYWLLQHRGQLGEALTLIKSASREWFSFALGVVSGYPDELQGRRAAIAAYAGLDGEQKKWYRKGIGRAVAERWVLNRISQAQSFDVLPFALRAEDLNEVYWGIGWTLREFFADDKIRARDWLRRIPRRYLKSAESGFRTYEEQYYLQPA